jgi:septum formation protein
MLEDAGVIFEVMPAAVDEDRLTDDLLHRVAHEDIGLALAEAKALAVSQRDPQALVIGSDQILSTGDAVLAKPGSREGARETLRRLRGKTHKLHSAVAVATGNEVIWRTVESATLHMKDLSEADLERYLDAAGESIYGCVGAYQIEGLGSALFETVEGDHFTIMGMPLLPLLSELSRLEGKAS